MSFKNIYGHDMQKRVLLSALNNNRLPHAYLFSGESGIGKKLVALNFAKILKCSHVPESTADLRQSDSCDACATCIKIENQTHPDISLIVPDGEQIKIEQVRKCKSDANLSAFSKGKKIFIIENAEKMNRQAANSFLKILEEPSGDVLFILISDKPLLPTISSRCQKLPFYPIQDEQVAQILLSAGIENKRALLAASMSAGRVQVALELAEDDDGGDEVKDIAIAVLSGERLNSFESIFKIAEEHGKDKALFNKFTACLLTAIRDILVYRKTGEINMIINDPDMIRGVKHKVDELVSLYRFIEDCRMKMIYNVNRQLVIEEILVRISRLPAAV